jgi:large subunit ribosomal protein L32
MGVPKRRTSKQRKKQRQANKNLTAPVLAPCGQCHALIKPHQLCPECGYYKGREVVTAK